ncbi:MAG TPA: hypothetical protein VFF29_04020 [Bacteroidota bacterium]|nr:hypothetical protein [Bacteroidota bacterium]
MSRSRRITPIRGITTAESEKKDKQIANRKLRRIIRSKLRSRYTEELTPYLREVSNVWSMRKDGKSYFDPKKFPKEMRK